MLDGFKTILIKNTTVSIPRASFSKGILTINKQAIQHIYKKRKYRSWYQHKRKENLYL
ncbi:hypothetical protein [Enterococcus italicus]|uniref:hypothetical protein n=1 Tax=Enterococcus italicus TaxID=246144 RepID=UPI003F460B9D